MKLAPAFLPALIVMLSVACDGGGRTAAWTGSIDTLPNGVVHVKNSAGGIWTASTAWSLEAELRLGSIEGEGQDVFGQVTNVLGDNEGHVFVLDRQAREIRLFDATGAYVRTIGRPGRGPGELQFPNGMAWGPDGRIWVSDPQNARYAVFDTSGVFIASHRRAIGGFEFIWSGGLDHQGRLYDLGFRIAPGAAQSELFLLRYDSLYQPTDTLRLPEGPPEDVFRYSANGLVGMVVGVPFAVGLKWTFDPAGYVWSGTTDQYRIYQRTPEGDTVRVIERQHERVPVTRQEREEALAGLQTFIERGGRIDESRIPSVKPVFERIEPAPDGYLWVRVITQRDGEGFDIFDPEGRYLGQLHAPVNVNERHPVHITRDFVYLVTTDNLDVPQVVRLRIRRP